ncbi:DUF4190 domain-containing protein [Corynebacterium lipophiloflavum]|uniref:Uncharacterized protein n=1 Tax=Corynebacterium lipophiloflavum (strain ATCC 700352 / DSM 44291 / CCUG 37336 / JCM 10383 / DMMZ 1944) TaxID=525263 RepID=C0XSL8_CORLD|nr:DUF4190 domain-containing protein [Corynebacterium lipophiloflavum]EEI16756.1 hypothetical protein HMPREF0298_1438 [Corynebacterium lipophiloflavum DSM 44291]
MSTPFNPNNSDPSGFNHPEGYTAYNPSTGHNPQPNPDAGDTYGPGPDSPLGNGFGTSNPDSVFSNDYASMGAADNPGYGNAAPQQNGLALAALIVGIIALLGIVFVPVAFLGGIVAIVLGALGLRKAKAMQPGAQRRGMAIAGIVMGAIALLLSIAFIALIGVGFSQFMNSGVAEQCQHLSEDAAAYQQCVTDFLENDPNSPLNSQGSS